MDAAPMTPPECDLTDFEFMPVMVRRLLKSDTWALGNGDERAAAVALWFESWHQVPAASLPGDERLLARLADTPKWARVKDQALRGWVKCTDGRMYHPVVAEKALEAWLEKLVNSISGAAGNAKRWQVSIDISGDVERVRVAADLLRALDPKAKALRKKAILSILSGSPPDSHPTSPPDSPPDVGEESPPDSPLISPPDRKGQGQRQRQGNKRKGAKAPLSAELPTWMQSLIDLWHEVLPELPSVVVMNVERQQAAKDFRDWVLRTPRRDGTPRATNDDEFLAWTRDFFTRARASDFIMGRGHRAPEHKNWRCSFEYLLSAKGMQKVIEQTVAEVA